MTSTSPKFHIPIYKKILSTDSLCAYAPVFSFLKVCEVEYIKYLWSELALAWKQNMTIGPIPLHDFTLALIIICEKNKSSMYNSSK
jgi:hypothetical protein